VPDGPGERTQRGGLVAPPQRGGLVIVDKPAGLTSHDVVARVRRLAGTRRVGHAGTLDPMATGVLLVGIGRATRLLGYLALHEKDYAATIRLGQTTSTDDAQGQVLSTASAELVTDQAVTAAVASFVGEIEQRPPAVSAIKVDGKRAYKRVRAGEDVVLATRKVTVSRFEVGEVRRPARGEVRRPARDKVRRPAEGSDVDLQWLDFDALVTCSSGTYIRSLARDVGELLGVGGHLAALRRTRVGAFDLTTARTLAELEADFTVTSLDEVAATAFVRRDLTADEALSLSHGGKLTTSDLGDEPVAAFGPDGEVVALLEDRDGVARALVVFVG
jgi:tRNA pseudouridine55 synthase